jgi:hypothetical protein
MTPWKSFAGIAKWTIRISLAIFIYTRFFHTLLTFNVNEINFYFALGFIITGFLMLAGGFKQTLTVVAGLVIFLLSVFQIILSYNGVTTGFAQWLLVGSIGLYFLATGNK